MRRTTAVVLVATTLAALVAATPIGGTTATWVSPALAGGDAVDGNATASDGERPELVAVGDDRLWPYVGPDRSFDRRASSINVVVRTDPATVRRYLASEGAWNRTDDGWGDDSRVADAANESVVADERVPWREAPGASRYTYVAGEGWLAERYQLDRGTYFGSRSHLRAYAPPDGDWTAVQAHVEHWDWFTVTHTVDSVERAQRRVETGFLGESAFTVRQVNYDNGDTYDADRWATVVALAVAPLVARRRLRGVLTARNADRVALAGTLAALPLVVRFGGVLFERHLAGLSADAVVAVWYPVLVAGVPLAACRLGRRVPATEAGALAGLGVGVGIVTDYAYLGIGVLPIPVAVHRAAAVVAVVLLAAGAASRSDAGDAPVGDAATGDTATEGDATGDTATEGDATGDTATGDTPAGDAATGNTANVEWPVALQVGAVLWVAVVVGGHLV